MKNKIVILIGSIVLALLVGFWFEGYSDLTNKTIQCLANYDVLFLPSKEVRIFHTDIAFVFILYPIGFSLLSYRRRSCRSNKLFGVYTFFILCFYLLFCYLEGLLIDVNITTGHVQNGILQYPAANVHYVMILLLSIFCAFLGSLFLESICHYEPRRKKTKGQIDI